MPDDNPPASAGLVEQATGEKPTTLFWMVSGALALAVFVAPFVTKYLPVSAELALMIAGIAIALIFRKSKGARYAGWGAAFLGLASWAIGTIGPMLGNLMPGGGTASNDSNAHPAMMEAI